MSHVHPTIRRGATRARRVRPRHRAALLACASALLVSACAPAARLRAGPGPEPVGAIARHVIVVSVDGLRPDAIERYGALTIQRLVREGRATMDARTVMPSLTLPSHTSMLTGVTPDVHGISWNDDQVEGRGLVTVPTVFGVARAHGVETAAFFGKAKFRHLMVPETLDYAQAPTGWWGRWSARRTVDDLRAYLAAGARPELLFVHIGEPDFAGHTGGWMTWLYGRAVRRADEAVRDILVAADAAYGVGEYTVLLTADHGGSGRTHGSAHVDDVTIPWIAWGAGVVPGPAPLEVRTTDTAATALWLLGIVVPEGWDGEPVVEAFGGEPAETPPGRI